jgi:hypothetical protein
MILKLAQWLQDGVKILKRIALNLLLWMKNNTIEIHSQIKRKKENLLELNSNLNKLRMLKEGRNMVINLKIKEKLN